MRHSIHTSIGLRGGNGMGEEIFGIESVEVLKGPSSTLYGQSVLGGIVNLRSKVPRPDAFAQVQFTGGSYGFYEPAIRCRGIVEPIAHALRSYQSALPPNGFLRKLR